MNLRSIDLNLLVALDSLLNHKNVTKAADHVGMSQPAMSRALGRLRKLFDDPLLARTKQGFVLTPRAKEVHEQLSRTLDQISNLIKSPTFDPREITCTFTVAILDHPSFLLLPGFLEMLSVHAPKISLNIVPIQGDIFSVLEANTIDLAVSVFDETPAGFLHQSLYQEGFKTILRKDHPALSNWTLPTFAGLRHALVSVSGDNRGNFLDEILKKQGLVRHIAAWIPNFLVLPNLVQNSDMIATIPTRLAETFAADYELEIADLPVHLQPYTLSQLWHERRNKDPLHQWMRARIKEAANPL